ncbi:PDZ domain-containing protein [Treponema endosymbiont of Eucomonympha sp.]|uniref:PDZ domain-containing protein n=1 Tax=Treponema endosymbiont of Eucomonympha sp. TaxID=1580831 RepID=UPI000781BAB0|nr:PDZ domain-containing protein [Treponema endosymbiont of Eucomonympha sp.]
MKYKNKLLAGMSGFAFFFTSCMSFSGFYQAYYAENSIPEQLLLQNDEKPQVFYSSHINIDAAEIESEHYVPIGYASLNGPEYDSREKYQRYLVQKAALKLCKEKRAKIALYSYAHTDTVNGSITLPTTQTSKSSGTIYSGGNSAWYSGTTTSTGSTATNYSVKRFDYAAILFIPLPEPVRVGVNCVSLTNEMRTNIQRNTGAFVRVVYKNTPAYTANIVTGDVIIKMNDTVINNVEDISAFDRDLKTGEPVKITLVRNQKELVIDIISD